MHTSGTAAKNAWVQHADALAAWAWAGLSSGKMSMGPTNPTVASTPPMSLSRYRPSSGTSAAKGPSVYTQFPLTGNVRRLPGTSTPTMRRPIPTPICGMPGRSLRRPPPLSSTPWCTSPTARAGSRPHPVQETDPRRGGLLARRAARCRPCRLWSDRPPGTLPQAGGVDPRDALRQLDTAPRTTSQTGPLDAHL